MKKTEKTILHCDLNNFFASVECLKYPELKNHPVAVCGNIENRHGIILAKNDAAKKCGVKTAEVVWEAKKKCPDLVLLSPHMDEYTKVSRQIRALYSEYTDLIEPFGIDECWLDVTGSSLLFGDGETIANTLRERVKAQTGLTISVGVSFNKIFAKLGSDLKKPDAVTVISRNNYKDKVWNLPATEMLGVGKATAKALEKYGIYTIGDIASSDEVFLQNRLGKMGGELFRNACGNGDSEVAHQNDSDEAKSIGNSTTCPHDLTTAQEAWEVFYLLSESVGSRLRQTGLIACGIQITIKSNDLTVKEYQAPLSYPTRHPRELANLAMMLFNKNNHFEKPVRMLGIRSFHLISDKQSLQTNLLFDVQKENELEQLEQKIADLRHRFGTNAVKRASLLHSGNISGHAREED